MNYSGFAKSGYFHLMQFYFTLYLADRQPFIGEVKNNSELLNSIFLVVLTYLISVMFAAPEANETSYASGYFATVFVLLAVVVNLVMIIREQIRSLIRYTKRKCKTGRFSLKIGKQSWKIKIEDTKGRAAKEEAKVQDQDDEE